jgi:hypothetical protein
MAPKSPTHSDHATPPQAIPIPGLAWLTAAGRGLLGKLIPLAGAIDDAARVVAGNSGRLVYDHATRSWISQGGLVYQLGPPRHGNRVRHILDHLVPNLKKATHSIFNVHRTKLISLVDDAWARRVGPGVLQSNGNRVWNVDMGRVVGTNGERHITIVIEDGTSNIITAFPNLVP